MSNRSKALELLVELRIINPDPHLFEASGSWDTDGTEVTIKKTGHGYTVTLTGDITDTLCFDPRGNLCPG